MVTTSAAVVPRPLVVERASLTIEGHALRDVSLGGWVYGPELGTAPVVVIVGGITASPFPFGDGEPKPRAARGVVARPVRPRPDRSRQRHRALPFVAGQRLDVARVRRPEAPPALSVPAWRTWWRRGSMAAAVPRRSPGSAPASAAWSAWPSPSRHPDRCAKLISISAACGPTAGARRPGTCSASWCATASQRRRRHRHEPRPPARACSPIAAATSSTPASASSAPGLDRPPVAEYLDHHGRRFAERFPVKTFLLLSEAIDRGLDRRRRGALRAGTRARQRRDDGRRRARRHAVSVGAAGGAASRAAGRRRGLVAVEARLGVRPRRVPRRSGEAGRRCCAARRRSAASGDWRRGPRFEGVGVEPVREIRIGLVGCGTVGRGVLEMIERQRDAVAERYGVRFRVSRIARARPDQGSRAARRRHSDRRSARSSS